MSQTRTEFMVYYLKGEIKHLRLQIKDKKKRKEFRSELIACLNKMKELDKEETKAMTKTYNSIAKKIKKLEKEFDKIRKRIQEEEA